MGTALGATTRRPFFASSRADAARPSAHNCTNTTPPRACTASVTRLHEASCASVHRPGTFGVARGLRRHKRGLGDEQRAGQAGALRVVGRDHGLQGDVVVRGAEARERGEGEAGGRGGGAEGEGVEEAGAVHGLRLKVFLGGGVGARLKVLSFWLGWMFVDVSLMSWRCG